SGSLVLCLSLDAGHRFLAWRQAPAKGFATKLAFGRLHLHAHPQFSHPVPFAFLRVPTPARFSPFAKLGLTAMHPPSSCLTTRPVLSRAFRLIPAASLLQGSGERTPFSWLRFHPIRLCATCIVATNPVISVLQPAARPWYVSNNAWG